MPHPFNFLSENQVITKDSKTVEHYSRDWTKQFKINSSGVLFPKTTEEVSLIVKACNERGLKIVPSGGRTGLSGGAVASNGEWVLSLEKMNKILEISPVDSSITVEAGVVTSVVQETALENGMYFPVEFSATGSSLIGGNVATNAGGVHVVRYGNTREWVKGLTVVTGSGEILKLNQGLSKNNTGYDFRHLFIASEGTLGVITEVELELSSPPKDKQVILLGVESLEKILDCFVYSKQKLPLMAFEMFTSLALDKVLSAHNLPEPLDSKCPYYVLIEVELGNGFGEDELTTALEHYFEQEWAVDGTMSSNSTQYENLWKYRELISESIAPLTPYKNDVSVKISKIPDFIKAIYETVMKENADLEVVIFGHIGDGNLHVNTLKPDSLSMEDFVTRCEKVNKILFQEIKKIGGSISAEHGVGLLKKQYLEYSRAPEEIRIMKDIKKSFDPNGVLNPGKIFD